MIFSVFAFEWETLARILGLAAAAGMDLPVLLVVPWLLGLLPWVDPHGLGVAGGLDSPAPAVLGFVLMAGWILVRRLPIGRTVLTLLLAGAGVVVAALLPWLISPAAAGGPRILESVVAVMVAGAIACVRMGWRFVLAHPPASLPGLERIGRPDWLSPALAGALAVGTLLAPHAGGLVALGLLCLALWPGRGALRAPVFALTSAFHRLGGTHRVPPAWALEAADSGPDLEPRGIPAALLGYGGGGLRPGWLIEGIGGDQTLCFRYRTLMGAWDLELSGAAAEENERGPLVHVRSIVREGARYVLLIPPGPDACPIGRTDPVQRNL